MKRVIGLNICAFPYLPPDDKENALLIFSPIILETLDDLKMAYPKATPESHVELESICKQLTN